MLLRSISTILLCICVTPALATVITESKGFFLAQTSWPGVTSDTHRTRSQIDVRGFRSFDPALGVLERVDISVKSRFNLAVQLADIIQKTPSPAGLIPLPYPYAYEVDFIQAIGGGRSTTTDGGRLRTLGRWTREHHGLSAIPVLLREYQNNGSFTFGLGDLDDFINFDGRHNSFALEASLTTDLWACCSWEPGTGGGITTGETDHPVYAGSAEVRGQIEVTYTYTEHAPTPVPEPGTLSLLAIGLVGGVWIRRRRTI